MADETLTVETNSETPTETAAVTATPTSTTDPSSPNEGATTAPPVADQPAPAVGDGLAVDPNAEAKAAAVSLNGAPEGDYQLTLPEGVALDAKSLEAITPLAKELNLSNNGLAALAERGMPIVVDAILQQQQEAVLTQRKNWETDSRAFVQGGKLADGTEVTANPAFAGENMDKVLQTAAKAIDRFTTDEGGQPLLFPNSKMNADGTALEAGTFRDYLSTHNMGNHPALLFAFFKAGQAISEDSDFGTHGATPQTKLTREEKYYPNSRK